MPISVTCPGCSTRLNAPDSAGGKKVKCPKPGCNTVIPVPAPLPPEPAFEVVEDPVPAPPPPPVRKPKLIQAVVEVDEDEPPRKKARRNDDDDDDDRPRKKRRDDDDEDDYDRPQRTKKRKKGGMAVGLIIALVGGSLALLGGIGFGIYALVGGLKASVPDGWVEYKSEKDNFRAYFPEKPKTNTIPAEFLRDEGVESISTHDGHQKKSSKRAVGIIADQVQIDRRPPGTRRWRR